MTFPLAHKQLSALADRGYALSRTFGLLLWGFIFWLAVSLGLSRNTVAGLFSTLAILVGLSFWQARGGRGALQWLREHIRYVISVELMFLLAFVALAYVRAHVPDATGTEKPMELAFINATLRSESFPPHDPWLSGYGISYYYFGYVMTAMLAKFTFTSGTIAFNLMLALVFALAVIGAYGLVFNLLGAYWHKPVAETEDAALSGQNLAYTAVASLMGPLFLIFVSNLEGFLEILHRMGIGWRLDTNGALTSDFWLNLNMKDLNMPPSMPFATFPDVAPERFWWWWRAARVVHDYDFLGNFTEVIDEFPFFSYLLGDLHPHVIALPFGLFVVSLALNLYLGGWRGEMNLKWVRLPIHYEGFVLLAIALGGLVFLNTWDFPIYLAIVGVSFALPRIRDAGWSWQRAEEMLVLAIPLAVVSLALYLPFLISFSSQAGGVAPNIIFPTRGIYLWIMFGPLFVAIFAFLFHLLNKNASWLLGFGISLGFVALLWVVSIAAGAAVANTPLGQSLIQSQGLTDYSQVLAKATARRMEYIGGLLTLVALLGWALSYLTGLRASSQQEMDSESHLKSPVPFVLGLICIGALLVIGPEFVYLRDNFGSRMNTVFKFYYQAWMLWAIAGAFGFVILMAEMRSLLSWIPALATILTMLMGLVYPVFSLPNRANNFSNTNLTLDASAYLASYHPDDMQVIEFLRNQPVGVIVEAVGGSYTEYGRISTNSGMPSLLNWPGHEGQWRGGYKEVGNREEEVRTIYESNSWDEIRSIFDRYHVRYVIVGDLERGQYPRMRPNKFDQMIEVFRSGNTVVYLVP